MKCDFCDLKAKVFLTQLVEGKMKKICLCEKCASEQGVTDPTGFSLTNMFQHPFAKALAISTQAPQESFSMNGGQCADCGFTLEDMRKVQRLGCPSCYQIFGAELAPILKGMHKGKQHVGKVPEGLLKHEFRAKRLQELQMNLDEAIASESYEAAAKIRDEILNLEHSIK